MKSGLHVSVAPDGASLTISPGKITVGGQVQTLSSALTINFAAGSIDADKFNNLVVKRKMGGVLTSSDFAFNSSTVTEEADGYLYTAYGELLYERVLASFPGLTADTRFPVFTQDGQEFIYHEFVSSDLSEDEDTSAYGIVKHGLDTEDATHEFDLSDILPSWIRRPILSVEVQAVGTNTNGAGTRLAAKSTQVGNNGLKLGFGLPSDYVHNSVVGYTDDDGLINVGLRSGASGDTADPVTVFVYGWRLPWNVCESQV